MQGIGSKLSRRDVSRGGPETTIFRTVSKQSWNSSIQIESRKAQRWEDDNRRAIQFGAQSGLSVPTVPRLFDQSAGLGVMKHEFSPQQDPMPSRSMMANHRGDAWRIDFGPEQLDPQQAPHREDRLAVEPDALGGDIVKNHPLITRRPPVEPRHKKGTGSMMSTGCAAISIQSRRFRVRKG